MKAARYSGHGGPEVVVYEEVPELAFGPADILVKVAACAVNRLDVIQRAGYYTLPGFRLPHIAGMDVTGVIVAMGADVANLAIGTRVVLNPSLVGVRGNSRFTGLDDPYGLLGVIGANVDGGYGEYCAAPASHAYAIPANYSLQEIACIPTSFVTAWHALTHVGRIEAGETLLVHAAGGGVSSAAIQLAKRLGARVLATARSDAKLEHARRMGADHVLNHLQEDAGAWAHRLTDGRGVDMVLDHVGPALWQSSILALRPRGRLVTCGATTGPSVTLDLGRLHMMGIEIRGSDAYSREEFERVLALYWQGGFRQIIDSQFALADAPSAHRRLEGEELAGKVLLVP